MRHLKALLIIAAFGSAVLISGCSWMADISCGPGNGQLISGQVKCNK